MPGELNHLTQHLISRRHTVRQLSDIIQTRFKAFCTLNFSLFIMWIPYLLLIVGGFLLILFFFFVGFRLVSSWQEVKVEMRDDFGRKSPRRFTKMLIGFLRWLERHMQYFQTPLRFVEHNLRIFYAWSHPIYCSIIIQHYWFQLLQPLLHVLLDVGVCVYLSCSM